MIVMDWNIQQMNSWWEPGSAEPAVIRRSYGGDGFAPPITDVPALAARVGEVINAVGPDLVTIQEGPGMPELVHFFGDFVQGDWKLCRGSGRVQALAVAARLGGEVTALEPGPETMGSVDLNQPFSADVNADIEIDEVEFARKPQVISLWAHGQQLLLLNNHLKSKFVPDAEERFNAGGDLRRSYLADALVVRRRISAEAFRIRAFLDEVFGDNPMAQIIVTGDLNDGPGADCFEEMFLTHSVVDRIFGSIFQADTQLVHVLFHTGSADFTAQFFDFIEGEVKDLVLDHIGLSRAIDENWDWQGRVAVAEYEAQRVDDARLEERDRLPSDHRPVVVEMTPKEDGL